MKSLFNKKTIFIATLAIIIAITTLVSVNMAGHSGAVTGAANTVAGPLQALTSTLARTFESLYGSIHRYNHLVDSHERLLQELAELRREHREFREVHEENERLRALLGFRERHPGHVYEPAVVRGWSASNWSSSFTINRGHANSYNTIKVGDSVVTDYGVLIGRVSSVGPTTSTVVSVLDTTFSAGAFIGEGGATATARGDFILMSQGLLMLDFIEDGVPILPGTSIVTSGIGGVFPIGLVIGEVVDVFTHDTGIGRFATVRPLLPHFESIVHVNVITDFEVVG